MKTTNISKTMVLLALMVACQLSFSQSVKDAVKSQDVDMLKKAFDNGGNANDSWAGGSAILWAVSSNVDIIKLLIDKGADPNQTNTIHASPLHCLVRERKLYEIDTLLSFNLTYNARVIKNCKGDTAKARKKNWLLHEDKKRFSSVYDKCKIFIERGANVNKYDLMWMTTPFLKAVQLGYYDLVDLMIKSGKPNFNSRLSYIGSATKNQTFERYETDLGYNPESVLPNAIILACYNHDCEMVKILVNGGADVNSYCTKEVNSKKEKFAPLDIAELNGDTAIVKYLRGTGARRLNNLSKNLSIKEVESRVYGKGDYCVAVVYKNESIGLGSVSSSFACYYVSVTVNGDKTGLDIINAAKSCISAERKVKPGWKEYNVLFFERNWKDCKKAVEAMYVLSDFEALFTTVK